MGALRRAIRMFLAALAFTASHSAISQAPAREEFRSTWFTPVLIESHDAVCPEVLEVARAIFPSSERYVDYFAPRAALGPLERVPFESLSTEQLPNASEVDARYPSPYVELKGRRTYLRTGTFPGCGGACETQFIQVSDEPIPLDRAARQRDKVNIVSTPYAVLWHLYRDRKGNYFAVAADSGVLHVFRIAPHEQFGEACSVSLAPPVRNSNDADVKAALASIEALQQAAGKISGGYGSCGSMKSGHRHSGYMHDALEQALYRPWALQGSGPPDFSEWAYQGLHEYRARAAFLEQYARTRRDVAAFFVRKNGWTGELASTIADDALAAAMNAGFVFGSDTVLSGNALEMQTRLAILDHLPIGEIRAISPSVAELDAGEEDAIVNVAIEYPEALRDLLARGANPNQANAFGKTPLMYAAQYNQLEAARILLEHGADPNASTRKPGDDCYYTLNTFRVTPLHYAARYASADMIRLLLKSGALTFVEVTFNQSGAFPLDWLRYYTREDATERNPNILPEEIPALEQLLKVPEKQEREKLATQLVREARSHYAKGRVQRSYRALKASLYADSGNASALQEMALVALRAGRLGEAAEAANETIRSGPSPVAKASGWFNMGLVCEQYGRRYLSYNGSYYCRGTPLQAYIQAWKMHPTTARRAKIEETIMKNPAGNALMVGACDVASSGGTAQRYLFTPEPAVDRPNEGHQHIYVYHTKSDVIDPDLIQWDVSLPENGTYRKRPIHPRVIERHDLGTFAITELKGDHGIQGPITVGSQTCSDPRK
jgi:tetratricopeptide (TPR) repeat protein